METTQIASVRWPGCGGSNPPRAKRPADAEARFSVLPWIAGLLYDWSRFPGIGTQDSQFARPLLIVEKAKKWTHEFKESETLPPHAPPEVWPKGKRPRAK
jgi:hypothetical protein